MRTCKEHKIGMFLNISNTVINIAKLQKPKWLI